MSLLTNLKAVQSTLSVREKYSSRHVQLAVADLAKYVSPCYVNAITDSDYFITALLRQG